MNKVNLIDVIYACEQFQINGGFLETRPTLKQEEVKLKELIFQYALEESLNKLPPSIRKSFDVLKTRAAESPPDCKPAPKNVFISEGSQRVSRED